MTGDILPLDSLKPISGEELLAMGDLGPCELVEGRIVRRTPAVAAHGGCAGNFCHVLESFVRRRKLGKVLVGEVGIYTRRRPDTVRAADVLFISNERYARCARKEGFLEIAPELVVEVFSPDDVRAEIRRKIREYFAAGVLLVWIADPRKRTVRAYRSAADFEDLTGEDILTGGDVLPGFRVRAASLFD